MEDEGLKDIWSLLSRLSITVGGNILNVAATLTLQ